MGTRLSVFFTSLLRSLYEEDSSDSRSSGAMDMELFDDKSTFSCLIVIFKGVGDIDDLKFEELLVFYIATCEGWGGQSALASEPLTLLATGIKVPSCPQKGPAALAVCYNPLEELDMSWSAGGFGFFGITCSSVVP